VTSTAALEGEIGEENLNKEIHRQIFLVTLPDEWRNKFTSNRALRLFIELLPGESFSLLAAAAACETEMNNFFGSLCVITISPLCVHIFVWVFVGLRL
jgi:hypothetical protein